MTGNNPTQVDWALAFTAGLFSFLSPCILPLIPGYLAFITGVSVEELHHGKRKAIKVFYTSLLFVLGFTITFTAMGASASFIGSFLMKYREILNKIFGTVIILAGLFIIGIIKIPSLYREKRFQLKSKSLGGTGIVIFGMAFAFGWTPCIGPILTSILLYASSSTTVQKGSLLLFTYSLGLGIPFILTALFYVKLISLFKWIKKHYRVVEIISGGLLIALGLSLFTGYLPYINNQIIKVFTQLGWKPR